MMTCAECQTNLDTVPVGTPCPNCGSLRRDATVSVQTVQAVARVHVRATAIGAAVGQDIAGSITAVLSQPGVREVIASKEITLRLSPPAGDDFAWLVEAWDGDKLISMAPSAEFHVAYLAVSDEIEDAVTDEGLS